MEPSSSDRPSTNGNPSAARPGPALALPSQTRSPWFESDADARSTPAYPPLSGDLEVDVAIVGGGITGLTAAYFLAQAGASVVVLEARRIVEGETGRTTAHLSAFPDARLSLLSSRFGKERARAVWSAGARAIELIERLVGELAVDCGFKRVPSFLYTESDAGATQLEKEHAACVELAIPSTLQRDDLPAPLRIKAALRFEDQAQLHPRQYLLPLAQAFVKLGGRIHEDTRVVRVTEDPTPVVTTARGTVRARDVIVAANVPVDNVVLLQTKIAHYRSYALGLRVAEPLPDGLFWDDLEPYHYVRKHRIEGSDLLLVGGEDHRTGQEVDTNERFQCLLAWARERFAVRDVAFRWSGQIIVPVDGLPYIGRNARSQHVWEATGFGGNGLTFGTIGARILADRIQGDESSFPDVFKATRVTPIASAVEFVRENASTVYHLVKDHLAIDPTNLQALPCGEGGIFNLRMKRVAAYRDDAGELHTFSPVCPHMHCIVAFNKAERTWDCPCHGSRFDVEGQVLNGPAKSGLERIVVELPLEHRPTTVVEPGRMNVDPN